MKTVFVFLAEGFEEIEAVTTIDLLRRAGLSVVTVAVGDSLEVAGAHHVPVIADRHISNVLLSEADALVLPGGLPGVTNLAASEVLLSMLREAYEGGKLLAAICAAPSILGSLGILDGKPATCYPSFEPQLGAYLPTEERVVVAGQVITACAAGVSIPFALAIVKALLDEETAQSVAQAIIY